MNKRFDGRVASAHREIKVTRNFNLFTIEFTDDIDKLPFYELNINGSKVVTNI